MIIAIILECMMFVLGLGGMAMFISEEALQSASMGMFLSIRAEDYKLANEMLATYGKLQVLNEDFIIKLYGPLNVFMWPAFDMFNTATKENYKIYAKLIKDGFEKEKIPLKVAVHISTQPTGAKIFLWVEDKWIDTMKITPELLKDLEPVIYYYVVSVYDARKKYYRQKLLRVAPVPGVKKEVKVNLYLDFVESDTETPKYIDIDQYIEKKAYVLV